MSSSKKTKITLHSVWNTENWEPQFQTEEVRQELYTYLRNEGLKHDILIDEINGGPEHIHCLLCNLDEEDAEKSIKGIRRDIRKWFKKQGFEKIILEEDFFVTPIEDKDDLEKTRKSIRNQQEYHQHHTVGEEYNALMERTIKGNRK